MDQAALDLRPAHEQALHADDQPAAARGPGGVRRLFPGKESFRGRGFRSREQVRAPPPWSAEPDEVAGTGPDGRWRAYSYDDLIARDKASLDFFWLRDESLSDSDNLPPPEVIAREIVEDLEAALEQFRQIAADLSEAVDRA